MVGVGAVTVVVEPGVQPVPAIAAIKNASSTVRGLKRRDRQVIAH